MAEHAVISHPLYKKALRLEYITIVWNVLEGLCCVIIGLLINSVSLFAYGLESSIEVFASGMVVWDLKGTNKNREKQALKFIGSAYLIVSAYIFFDGVKSLLEGNHPQASTWGIIFMVLTVIMMGTLGLMKRQVGGKIGSETVLADAKFTLIDGALAGTVLIGLVANAFWGWWWTDQALALFLSGVAFREGLREVL